MSEIWTMPALPSGWSRAAAALFFVTVCFAIYGQSLHNEFVRFDDGLLIFENPISRGPSLSNIRAAFTSYDPELYIPLTLLSYQIDYMIGGIDPYIFHLHSLLLHILNAMLVTWLAYLLSSSGRIGLLTGTLWAIHPINTEAVAWAAALKDVQSTSFFLMTLIAYLSYQQHGRRLFHWLSIGLFVLGLLSKAVILTLPIILVMLHWRYRDRVSRKTIIDVLPFVMLSIIFGIIALFGKTTVIASTTPLQTMLMAAKSTIFYLGTILWPSNLSVLYPFDGTISITSLDFLAPLLGVFILIGIAIFTSRFSRDIPFAVTFYLITLTPTFLNFSKVGVYFVASDRYAYIPAIGLFFLIAVAIDALLSLPGQRMRVRRRSTTIGAGIALVVILLSITAHAQSRVWKNTETLFQHALRIYPSSFIARNNLGNVYYRQGRWDDAIREYSEGLAYGNQTVLVHNNLARAYGKKHLVDQAVAQFEQSLALEPNNQETYVELGRMYAENGRINDALAAYASAIDLQPGYAITYVNRASLLVNNGRIAEAFTDLHTAIGLDDSIPQAHYNLGLAYAQSGDLERAITSYETAVQIEPSLYEAHFNLGALYAKVGRLHEARLELVAAQRIKPGNRTIDSAIQQIDDALAAFEAR